MWRKPAEKSRYSLWLLPFAGVITVHFQFYIINLALEAWVLGLSHTQPLATDDQLLWRIKPTLPYKQGPVDQEHQSLMVSDKINQSINQSLLSPAEHSQPMRAYEIL